MNTVCTLSLLVQTTFDGANAFQSIPTLFVPIQSHKTEFVISISKTGFPRISKTSETAELSDQRLLANRDNCPQ